MSELNISCRRCKTEKSYENFVTEGKIFQLCQDCRSKPKTVELHYCEVCKCSLKVWNKHVQTVKHKINEKLHKTEE